MCRISLILSVAAWLVTSPFLQRAWAQGPLTVADEDANLPASLKVGDPAPALHASKWLQGDAVPRFLPGKVYVVEFWATWCGPCIAFMPELGELQTRYKDKGVTIIGFSTEDADNTEDKVTAFVKKRGPKLPYTFAYAAQRNTEKKWMKAAGRVGIPCTFVVDQKGRIAYIGHPMYLGIVLPKVVAGDPEARMVGTKVEQEFAAVSAAMFPDHKAGLQALKDFEAKYPSIANNPAIVRAKLSHLPEIGEIKEAKKLADAMLAKAIKRGDPSALAQVAAILRNGPGKENKELLAVAVKAAEVELQMTGGQDASALISLAATYFVAGDKAKARENSRRAVKAAAEESAALRQYVEQQARKIDDQK